MALGFSSFTISPMPVEVPLLSRALILSAIRPATPSPSPALTSELSSMCTWTPPLTSRPRPTLLLFPSQLPLRGSHFCQWSGSVYKPSSVPLYTGPFQKPQNACQRPQFRDFFAEAVLSGTTSNANEWTVRSPVTRASEVVANVDPLSCLETKCQDTLYPMVAKLSCHLPGALRGRRRRRQSP